MEGDTIKCLNHWRIILIRYPGKVMLNIILRRLIKEAEGYLAEEQTGFKGN